VDKPAIDAVLDRREALAQALLDASHDLTFPMNVNQFFRLDGLWYPHWFKVQLGIRATKIHKAIFGRLPAKKRVKTGDRNETAHYPRGVLVQAFTELRSELGDELQPETPYRKVAPSQNLIDYRWWQPTNQSGAEAHRWVKVPEDATEMEVRRLTGERPPKPAEEPLSPLRPVKPASELGLKLPRQPRAGSNSAIGSLRRDGASTPTFTRGLKPIIPERNRDGVITTDAEREAERQRATVYFAEIEAREKALELYDGNGQPVNDAAREVRAREDAEYDAPEHDDRDYTEWNRRKAEAKAVYDWKRRNR
jgi:hypothetical protein